MHVSYKMKILIYDFFTLEMHVLLIGNFNTNNAEFIILHLKCTSLFEHLYELSDNLIY